MYTFCQPIVDIYIFFLQLSKLNAKSAKTRWQHLETKITKVALQKQAVSQMENDMDRWLKDREKLSHKLERMKLKRKRLMTEKGQASKKLVEDLDDQIENLTSNVNYLQENIMECQQNIMQMEQTNEELDNDDIPEEELLTKMVCLHLYIYSAVCLQFLMMVRIPHSKLENF